MKRTALASALVASTVLLMLNSCDAMFNTNIFKAAGLGQVNIGKASSAAEIAAAATSPQFYTDLSTNQTTKDAMLTTLMPNYSSGSVPSSTVLAASLSTGTTTPANLVLASTILINTTEAGTIVNSIAPQLPVLAGSPTSSDLVTAIKASLPASVLSDQTAFTKAIGALVDAASPMTAVANYVGPTGSLPAPPSGTSQDTAYYGLVSLAVASMAPAAGSGYATTADALYAVVSGAATASVLSPPNTAIFDPSSTSSAAGILLSAAGVSITALK